MSRVAIVTATAGRRAILGEALDRGGLWPLVEGLDGPVVVLVDGTRRDPSTPIGSDPVVIEMLVDALISHGVGEVVVGLGPAGDERWLQNRDPVVAADLVGYRFTTDDGNDYDVIDLAADLVPAPVPAESCLSGMALPRAWIDAGLRVCVSGNRTDEEFGFALTTLSLLGLLPDRDPSWHYGRLQAADLAVDLLRFASPSFVVVDAIVSNHGRFGSTRPRPLTTDTVIAGVDPLLVDFVGAIKMGLDPYQSPVNAKGLREIGLPAPYEVDGPLDVYEGWVNPHPLTTDAVRRLSTAPSLADGRTALLSAVDSELFPFASQGLQRANRVGTRVADRADRDPYAYALATWAACATAAAVDGLEGWRILWDKDRLTHRDVPLDLPLGEYADGDYEAVADYIEPLEHLVRATKPDARGLRWRLLDGSVLFEMARDFEIDFEDFSASIDIACAIGFMYDYIGGRTVPVRHDVSGRVVHQAERNLYLPQPNWMVLFGGKCIDVAKLELVRYRADEHKIMWRTVRSANDSAEFDDGSVSFTRLDRGTRVTVAARQKFTLPPSWQLIDIDLYPEVIHPIIADAYGRFFERTLDNFRAAYEGERFRIGHPWPAEREPSRVVAGVRRVRSHLLDGGMTSLPARLSARAAGKGGGGSPSMRDVDDDGFVHFTGHVERATLDPEDTEARTWRHAAAGAPAFFAAVVGFWSDLAKAAARDLGTSRDPEA